MDARSADDVMFWPKQLDGPRHLVIVEHALIPPRPIEFVDVLKQASVGVGPEDARKARAWQLVVEVQPVATRDSIGLTVAHEAPNGRHACRDLGRIVGAEVDISDDIGSIPNRLEIEADAEIGPRHDAVEQARLELPLDKVASKTRPVLPAIAARDLAVQGVDAETEIVQSIRFSDDVGEISRVASRNSHVSLGFSIGSLTMIGRGAGRAHAGLGGS